MEKIDFQNYRALVREVKQLRDYVRTIEAALDSIPSPQLSFTPKGPPSSGSAMTARVARYLDIKALYEERLAESEAQVLAVERAIQTLASPAERVVMRLRYMEGRSWTSVCMELQLLGYSERQVYRLHGYALMKLKEV